MSAVDGMDALFYHGIRRDPNGIRCEACAVCEIRLTGSSCAADMLDGQMLSTHTKLADSQAILRSHKRRHPALGQPSSDGRRLTIAATHPHFHYGT